MDEYLNHFDQNLQTFRKYWHLDHTSCAQKFPGASNVQKSMRTNVLVMERSGKKSYRNNLKQLEYRGNIHNMQKVFQEEGATTPKAEMGNRLVCRKIQPLWNLGCIVTDDISVADKVQAGHIGPCMACKGFYPVGNETPLKNFMKGIDT